VTYHFAGKEDLVAGLLDELRARNDARPTTAGHVTTVPDLLRRFEEALVTQLEYRCLTESIVHVVKTWPRLHERYHSVETARRRGLANAVRALVHAGELAGPTEDADVAVLVATWSLIGRFWLAESGISYRDASPEQAVGHYVALVAASLQPWVRDPQVLRPWRTGVLTDAALGR
jgi:AcrR family transcriptional regulator